MEPIKFVSIKDEEGKNLVLTEREIFNKASKFYDLAKYHDALNLYNILIKNFHDSIYIGYYYYNRGLTNKGLGEYNNAILDFTEAQKYFLSLKDKVDAIFLEGLCYFEIEDWNNAILRMNEIYENYKDLLNKNDILELITKIGICYLNLEKFYYAEKFFKEALKFYFSNKELILSQNSHYASQAQFLIGEIYKMLFESISLKLPLNRMKKDLDDKSYFFIKAQMCFLKTLHFRNNHWSLAAGYRIGELYEMFYNDLMKAEIPNDLTEEEKSVYFDELKKYIKPLVERAISIYKKNLEMGLTYGINNEWLRKTEENLNRLRNVSNN